MLNAVFNTAVPSVEIVLSVGVSATAATLTLTVIAVLDAAMPSCAFTVKAASVPLAFDAGVQVSEPPEESVLFTAWDKVPLVMASMRKEIAWPSRSASFAAFARSV